jgi:hypothetical protein
MSERAEQEKAMSETVSPSEDPLQGPGDVGNSPDAGDLESGGPDPRDTGGAEAQSAEGSPDGDEEGGMDVPPTSNDDMQDGSSGSA